MAPLNLGARTPWADLFSVTDDCGSPLSHPLIAARSSPWVGDIRSLRTHDKGRIYLAGATDCIEMFLKLANPEINCHYGAIHTTYYRSTCIDWARALCRFHLARDNAIVGQTRRTLKGFNVNPLPSGSCDGSFHMAYWTGAPIESVDSRHVTLGNAR